MTSGRDALGWLLRRVAALLVLCPLIYGATTSVVASTVAAASSSVTGTAPAYWLEGSDGGVYQHGSTNFGTLKATALARPIVGGTATPDGLGYWLVASDGGVFSFGDAAFHGSTGDVRLNEPIVGMAAYPSSGGYWLVASDGGIFTFGGAGFWGSTGNVRLNEPIVGMAATPDGKGYWLVASDGGVFSFGDAAFHGSTGNVQLTKPIVGMAATPMGRGYWLVASDGGLFTFGDAPFLGASTSSSAPVVGMMSTAHGYPFPPGGTGHDVSVFNCPPYRNLPSGAGSFNIIEVNGDGTDHNHPNPCYGTEASWSGLNLSSYIFLNGLTSPEGAAQSFDYGYQVAQAWVNYSESIGIDNEVWWLDVETSGNGWNLSPSAQSSNGQVIAGAVTALRALGRLPGIYATSFQWGEITGNSVTFPGIALWVPGATSITDPTEGAIAMCKGNVKDHIPFAGGRIILIQYDYNDPNRPIDLDYACA